jgi:hypothetical protein
MKRLAITAALCALTGVPASAFETWQGDLFVTTATSQCTTVQGSPNVTVNDFFRAVFRPAGVSDNGPDSKLALYHPRNAHHIEIDNKALTGSGNFAGRWITGGGNFVSYAGTYVAASATPAPAIGVETVVVHVQVRKFGNTVGCNVTLHGSLGNRP